VACDAISEGLPIRGSIIAALCVLLIGLGGFGVWASTAPISSAAVASGIIAVDSKRKVVQHLEGGAIAELLVREGDHVSAGQVLMRLDDLEAKAQHDLLENQYVALSAQEARLSAVREGRDRLNFSDELNELRARPEMSELLSAQERIFASAQETLEGQIDVLNQRIAQSEASIAAFEAQRRAGSDQLVLIEQELTGVRGLVKQGLATKPRQLALEREAARLTGLQGDYENRMAQARETIAQTKLEILNARQARVEQAASELGDVEARRAQTGERLAEARAKLGRRDLVAPNSGTVLNLRYHTLGGIIPPGGEILDLVPEKDRLIIEAKLRPTDIDVVRTGLPVQVALTAYKSRTTPRLNGRVAQVSADALQDQRTGQYHYNANIEIDQDELARLRDIQLYPGMPVENFINTGERTFAAYLMQPLTDSFHRAFREE
jgi:HlyD family type I secretion membrane fusion protein